MHPARKIIAFGARLLVLLTLDVSVREGFVRLELFHVPSLIWHALCLTEYSAECQETGQPHAVAVCFNASLDRIYADFRYEDESGPQLFLVTQNRVRIGRGADDDPMDLALYTKEEVSREHAHVRRDGATGRFFIVDRSTNGTWVDGKRLKRDVEQPLPERAEIGIAEILTLLFQVRS